MMNKFACLPALVLIGSLVACAPSTHQTVTLPPATQSASATLPYIPAPTFAYPLAHAPTSTPPAPPTAVIPPIATAIYPLVSPQAGLANAFGRVLWNDQPVKGTKVELCSFTSAGVPGPGECTGPTASVKTDEQGIYSFLDIAPAQYLVLVNQPGTDSWFYYKQTDSTLPGYDSNAAQRFTLAADQVFVIGDMNIYKNDLKLTFPADQAVLSEIPTLAWEIYPGAAVYVVTLGYSGDPQQTQVNSLKPGGVIQNCDYPWKVEAYNSRGVKISEAWNWSTFFMVGQASSCHVLLTGPAAGANVPEGQPIQFIWQPNALATEYELYISEAPDPFVRVTSPSYTLAAGLPAGEVTWQISVYKDSKVIASSDYGHFTVGPAPVTPNAPAPTSTAIPAQVLDNPFVLIPAGSFKMGGNKCMVMSGGNCLKWEPGDDDPPHTVSLDAFKINAYEVTDAQYAACVAAGMCPTLRPGSADSPSDHFGVSSYENFPVASATWFQASAFCAWAGGRLPSEAEWEKAARGGLAGQMYPWGNQAPVCKASAKNGAQTGRCEPSGTLAVGSYAANGYGLFDMAGNLAEWVNDWYQADYYKTAPASNPTGPGSGDGRVIRGGSYGGLTSPYGDSFSVYTRGYSTPTMGFGNIGFRCAADAGQ